MNEKINIIKSIGKYYHEKNNHDNLKARNEINFLEISSIDYKNEILSIKLQRPGLLIGWHGQNIDNLEQYLKKEYNIKSINIIEKSESSFLTIELPIDYLKKVKDFLKWIKKSINISKGKNI